MRLPFKKGRLSIGLLAGVATLVAVTSVAAKGPGIDDVLTALGLIDGKVDSITVSQSNIQTDLNSLTTTVAAVSAREDEIRVDVDVWEDACIGISIQCTSYHTTAPASSSNHNPVAIRFFVTRNGQAVHGLTSSQVVADFNGAPASGPGLERCDNGDGECSAFGGDFQDLGSGLYVLWVHPFFAPPAEPTWQRGSYPVVITITDIDAKSGTGFGTIEISS